jgi:hypothetical protein
MSGRGLGCVAHLIGADGYRHPQITADVKRHGIALSAQRRMEGASMNYSRKYSSHRFLWCLIAIVAFTPMAKSLELYFIGNSLTALWDVPAMVDSLGAHANPPIAINTMGDLIGNSEIATHFTPECFAAIRNGGYDFVVLQAYQQVYLDPQAFYSAARRMNDSIIASGARTVFYMPWALLHVDPNRTGFDSVAARYDSIGAELGAMVSPAGRAWQTLPFAFCREQLYIPNDQVHATPPGAYLAACVIFATITGRSPEGNSYNPIRTPFVSGQYSCDSSGPALQRLAWETANGYNVLDKTPPSAPTGLAAQALSPTSVRLTWTQGVDAESKILRTHVYRDGQLIADVAGQGTAYIDNGVTEATQYSYQVSCVNVVARESARCAPTSVTTPVDTIKPAIAGVYAHVSVVVGFSEPVEKASAENSANYTIDKGIVVSGAALQPDLRTVVLTVPALTAGATYTLTVNNIRDRAKVPNTLAPGTNAAFRFAGFSPGLRYEYFEGSVGSVAGIARLDLHDSGTVDSINLTKRGRDNDFAFRFTGWISAPAGGQYTFYLTSDDGSRLYAGNNPIVDNDGSHAMLEKNGQIQLNAGMNPITVLYYQGNGGFGLEARWSGPGIAKQIIPASAFFHVPGEPTIASVQSAVRPSAHATVLRVHTNRSGSSLVISVAADVPSPDTRLNIRIYDFRGRLVQTFDVTAEDAGAIVSTGLRTPGGYFCRVRAGVGAEATARACIR